MLATTNAERVVALPPESPEGFDVHRAYGEHGGALYGFAFNSTRDGDIAEDCVQETFVRAWRAREKYSADRGSQRTWLFAIARNVVVDALRARARRPSPVPDEHLEGDAEPRTEASAVVDRIVIHCALATLSAEHREVIVAVQLDGLTYQQLSERTGVPAATLRTRMFYGMKALRDELTEEDHR
ncbi:RNA polymerase sigma factor [Brachybacterium sp.]|uniref:RNA polymerase sigma factor n=1 Tax=Brachybacterium sp. TaxID=1891286 RepID=UPI002ED0060B